MDDRLIAPTTRRVVFLVSVAMSVATLVAQGQMATAAADVEAREIAFAKTMADRDLDAFRTFISPEAIFFNGNEPLRGRDAIVRAWASYFEGPSAPFSWHPDVVEVLESGNLALSSGPVRNASGEVVGRFNSIWRKDADGQWWVVFDKGS
jgi:ketosteroid isomerase-like protein